MLFHSPDFVSLWAAYEVTLRYIYRMKLQMEFRKMLTWYWKLCLFFKLLENLYDLYFIDVYRIVIQEIKAVVATLRVLAFCLFFFIKINFIENSEISKLLLHPKKRFENYSRLSTDSIKLNKACQVKLLTTLPVDLIHLRELMFRRNSPDYVGPFCIFRHDDETTSHYIVHCWNHSNKKTPLWQDLLF